MQALAAACSKTKTETGHQRDPAVAEQQTQPPLFVRLAIGEIVVYRLAEIGGAFFGQLIGWQVDHKTQRALARNLFGRADDILFSVLVEITLVKGRGIERIE